MLAPEPEPERKIVISAVYLEQLQQLLGFAGSGDRGHPSDRRYTVGRNAGAEQNNYERGVGIVAYARALYQVQLHVHVYRRDCPLVAGRHAARRVHE